MIMSRLARLLAVVVLLGGCVAGPHGAYYKPSYPDPGVAFENRDCGGKVGPVSVLKIPTPDGFVRVRVDQEPDGRLALNVLVGSSGFSALKFTSNVIRLKDLDRNVEWAVEATNLDLGFKTGQIGYREPVDLATKLPVASDKLLGDLEVWLPFSVDDFSPDKVRVHLPPIEVGGNMLQIPPLRWMADREGKTVEGYEKGWDWWPYFHDPVTVGDFTIKAGVTGGPHRRSSAGTASQGLRLSGNIMIDFPATVRWRFSTNEVGFEDVDSGKVTRMTFRQLRIQSALKAAFTAEFCCTTSASVSVPIGASHPENFSVQLPPLLINGKPFVIQAIRFSLRRFEFGIYPINC